MEFKLDFVLWAYEGSFSMIINQKWTLAILVLFLDYLSTKTTKKKPYRSLMNSLLFAAVM